MPSAVIDNPILNSPFHEPERHFRFSDEGITDEVADGRRESGYFLPIASPRKKSGQMKFETEWTQDRFFASPRINRAALPSIRTCPKRPSVTASCRCSRLG